MSLLQTLLAFVVALGSLIIFHELGHYLVARWCGVKVLRFSVGMGKVVWSRRFGPDQTEWAVSALPLGGYVKMLDSRESDAPLSEADLKREFTRQNVWKRIAIVAAGPIANFLLAIFLFAALYMHGVAEPAAKVAPPAVESAAARAGLKGGDLVTAVNGERVRVWSDLRWQLIQAAIDKKGVTLDVERQGGGRHQVELADEAMQGLDVETDVAAKLGVSLTRPPAKLGEIMAGSAAERAGLQSGDLVTAINGEPVADWIAFTTRVRASGGKLLLLQVLRGGQSIEVPATPDVDHQGTVTVGKIGAYAAAPTDMIEVTAGPVEAVARGAAKVWDTSVLTLKMMGKMVVGEVSWKNVTGPITIADYAGQTARIGVASYLSFIAFISISLGVMNLLPIPVLDGGLLLYYSLEVLTGRPVPERFGEIAQRLGVGLLVTLMALAVFNDVVRLL
ncbi:RIP metalloprotease RseP [Pseudoduganella namucuonensis]|uniref:Zinc metalloprotease n=1 Tax=Pseudoduganella namucuonensis TaxID=1035707 RepID=A0A1I7M2U2_9BURK|nr:RIP metalloprotease RseP [Pseudoduganella namucuonensis]SFV16150.1 regulator of sigma E protease [Pseudoduganella namucuonensis]